MTSEEFFTQIKDHFNNELPFVVYRKPDEISVKGILQKDDKLNTIADFTETGFIFSPFNTEEISVLIPVENSEIINCDFVILDDPKVSGEESQLKFFDEESKNHHINLVKNGIEAIVAHQFQKVVLSRCEEVKLSEANPIQIFKRLLSNYKSAFVYCWYHPKIGLWLGATPETLLKVEGNRFSTMALAGTQEFNGTLDVAWQNKEKQEQQFVTDFIVSSLQSSVNNLNVSEVETIKAGNLLHLKTSISGTLTFKFLTFKQLLFKLSPTPAVCGLPKAAAKQFILENENYNREFYTGFLGELNLKESKTRNTNRRNVENNAYASIKTISNLYVNLRCMQLKKDNALIYVGGGITQDSIPENEWQETVSKAMVMKTVL
jgi:isochorismate synthase